MSETKPWSKNSPHLIFENIFNQMRKPQNTTDQSAFHLSAAYTDVQPSLLMATLEENKTTVCVRDGQTHVHTQPWHCQKMRFCEDLHTASIHSSILSPLQVQEGFYYIISPAGSCSCFCRIPRCPKASLFLHWVTGLHLGLFSIICSLVSSERKLTGSILWITSDCSIQSESAAQLQGLAGSNSQLVMTTEASHCCRPWFYFWL